MTARPWEFFHFTIIYIESLRYYFEIDFFNTYAVGVKYFLSCSSFILINFRYFHLFIFFFDFFCAKKASSKYEYKKFIRWRRFYLLDSHSSVINFHWSLDIGDRSVWGNYMSDREMCTSLHFSQAWNGTILQNSMLQWELFLRDWTLMRPLRQSCLKRAPIYYPSKRGIRQNSFLPENSGSPDLYRFETFALACRSLA